VRSISKAKQASRGSHGQDTVPVTDKDEVSTTQQEFRLLECSPTQVTRTELNSRADKMMGIFAVIVKTCDADYTIEPLLRNLDSCWKRRNEVHS